MFAAAERIAETFAELQSRLKSAEQQKELQSVQAFFDDDRLSPALAVHNAITEWSLTNREQTSMSDARPTNTNSRALVADVLQLVSQHPNHSDAREVQQLLHGANFTVRHRCALDDCKLKFR